MKRCKHEFTRLRFKDGSERQGLSLAEEASDYAHCAISNQDLNGFLHDRLFSARCDDCGAQLALGPSNDAGCEVEIRAAELISRRASGDPMMFERLEQRGHHGIVLEDGEEFLASWQAGFALMEWICCDDDRPEKSDPSTKFGDARRRWW